MQEKTKEEEIGEIVDHLIGPVNHLAQYGQLGGPYSRMDLSRPNIHDSKREFLIEKNAVSAIIKHLEGAIGQVVSKEHDTDRKEMLGRLNAVIDYSASKSLRTKKVVSASDLAVRNIAETGFYYSSLFVVLEMINVYKERLIELDDQEKQFWSVSNRPPNYYARTIALRLARLFAKQKRQRPTFGIAREGNHPSTDFGRALEQVFSVLDIKASVRNAAEWAIEQLTEDDIDPPVNTLLGGLFGAMGPSSPIGSQRGGIDDIEIALGKGLNTKGF